MWCFARLFHYPGADLLQAISLYCLRHWHRFKAQELASMLWSLALLRACSADTWCAPSRPVDCTPRPCYGCDPVWMSLSWLTPTFMAPACVRNDPARSGWRAILALRT